MTFTTLFWVPKQFGQILNLSGSSIHSPSTQNLYSMFPGGSIFAFIHVSFLSLCIKSYFADSSGIRLPVRTGRDISRKERQISDHWDIHSIWINRTLSDIFDSFCLWRDGFILSEEISQSGVSPVCSTGGSMRDLCFQGYRDDSPLKGF